MTENEEDHADVSQSLKLVKEVIAAVDNKVNEHEKKKRLKEVYSRTDSKSIMRMKSGQMFAREDLLRGRKLIHDGPLQLKNSAGRLKGENQCNGFIGERIYCIIYIYNIDKKLKTTQSWQPPTTP